MCPDLTGFERTLHGISDKPVGSLAEWIPEINMDQVHALLWAAFAEVFWRQPGSHSNKRVNQSPKTIPWSTEFFLCETY